MKTSDGKSCPHCGSDAGYVEKVYVSGFETRFFDWAGEGCYYSGDNVRYSDVRSVTCVACQKRVTPPEDTVHSTQEKTKAPANSGQAAPGSNRTDREKT